VRDRVREREHRDREDDQRARSVREEPPRDAQDEERAEDDDEEREGEDHVLVPQRARDPERGLDHREERGRQRSPIQKVAAFVQARVPHPVRRHRGIEGIRGRQQARRRGDAQSEAARTEPLGQQVAVVRVRRPARERPGRDEERVDDDHAGEQQDGGDLRPAVAHPGEDRESAFRALLAEGSAHS
jgi:hypothetical protein